MKIAVLRFPGSNCDQDALHAIRGMGVGAEYVWHRDTSLAGFDGVFVPGGFSYGDYLRSGAIAARSPIVGAVKAFAEAGGPVLGACNGFQILCETGLLPGALLRNESQKFVCQDVYLKAEAKHSFWTRGLLNKVLRVPIAHKDGRFTLDPASLEQVEREGLVAFRYVQLDGSPGGNPNGSLDDIAGLVNARGNVLGLMPHPERAANEMLGNTDGLEILRGFFVPVG